MGSGGGQKCHDNFLLRHVIGILGLRLQLE